MIRPSKTGYIAMYQGGSIGRFDCEVVGWREGDGAALVVDRKAGRLVPAAEYAPYEEGVFSYITNDGAPCVAAVPGQGWSARYSYGKDTPEEEPVIAFAVHERGGASVVVATPDRICMMVPLTDLHKLIPPSRLDDDQTIRIRHLARRAHDELQRHRTTDLDDARVLLQRIIGITEE